VCCIADTKCYEQFILNINYGRSGYQIHTPLIDGCLTYNGKYFMHIQVENKFNGLSEKTQK